MKKSITLFLFNIILPGYFLASDEYPSMPLAIRSMLQSRLFDADDNKPTRELEALLAVLNVKHDGSCASVVKEMQSKFYKKGFECHQIQESPCYNPKTIMPCFEKLNMLQEVAPQKPHYDGCIVLDAHYLDWMRDRLAYLNLLTQRGVQFKKLYVCAGNHSIYVGSQTEQDFFEYDAPLLPLKKEFTPLQELPTTEIVMIQMLLDQVEWQKPLSTLIENKEWVYSEIDLALGQRPTTANNIKDFIQLCKKSTQKKGSYFVLSNQPHVGYQHAVFLTHMLEEGSTITIDTGGPQDAGSFNMAQHLDRLSRWVYQENQLLNSLQAH